MDLSRDQLLHVAFDAAGADQGEPPPGLSDRIMHGAIASGPARVHPGWLGRADVTLTPLDAFIQTAAQLAALIDGLAPEEWAYVTRTNGATVRQVIEHLVGVERYILGQLGRRPRRDAPRQEDHWPVARLAGGDLATEPTTVVARTWWLKVLDLVATCAELGPDHAVAYHHLAGSAWGLLVVRTFELWTHGDDIRHAIGRPLDVFDQPRLALMVGELMQALPWGLAICGCAQPGRTARLVLTGTGGGQFDVPLAPDDPLGPPDVVVRTSVLQLCRLASNRLSPGELDVVVEGDASLLEPILVGAAAFAAD